MKKILFLLILILTSCYTRDVDDELITDRTLYYNSKDSVIMLLPVNKKDSIVNVTVDSLLYENDQIYILKNSLIALDIDTTFKFRDIQVYGQDWRLFRLNFTSNRCSMWAIEKTRLDSIKVIIKRK